MMRIAVGKVIKPHGIRGEVKILPETFDIERFYDLDEIVLKQKNHQQSLIVDSVRITTDGKIFVHFEGIDDRDAAELLRNGVITVSPDESLDLPEDTYYHYQLEGMLVFDRRQDKEIGIIEEIIDTAADDIYVVKNDEREYLIPARKEFVKFVDVPNKRMEIESIPGLLDL